jgi:hypothetical protein
MVAPERQDGSLGRFFSPSLTDHERKVAEIEGSILGVARWKGES